MYPKEEIFPGKELPKIPCREILFAYAAYELAMKAYLAKSLTDDIILSYCLDSGEKYG